jgi:hypothetical protein
MLQQIGEAAFTSLGFFWKAGWALVLGYFISAMIEAFVPKQKLVKYMGDSGLKSVGIATLFGAVSSSCSFAALAAGRSLFKKGAHFIPLEENPFQINYTLWFNLIFIVIAAVGIYLFKKFKKTPWSHAHEHGSRRFCFYQYYHIYLSYFSSSRDFHLFYFNLKFHISYKVIGRNGPNFIFTGNLIIWEHWVLQHPK